MQEDVLMSGIPDADKSEWANKEKLNGSTFASDSSEKKQPEEYPLKDGNHRMWKCENFSKMIRQARIEKAGELKLCFYCLTGKHVVKDCTYKTCGVEDWSERLHLLLH